VSTDQELHRIRDFQQYAALLSGDEKGEAQVYCDRLFIAFGHQGYKEAGAQLESRLKSAKQTTSFIDLRWGSILLIEMKKRGEKLQRHYQQAFDYWLRAVPHRPRYVILCNFDEFWIYDFDLQLSDPIDRVNLSDLHERYAALSFLFPDNRRPVFRNDRVAVTRSAADKVAVTFNALVARGIDRASAQRFVLQCVTSMFAEDIGLLPHKIFTEILYDCLSGSSSYDLLGGLYRQMNERGAAKAGRYRDVPYFNGGLFNAIDPIELTQEELKLLEESATENWSKVQPAIFGTLFQGSMDKGERHALGAHFTHEADIQRVVIPTIVRPWREAIGAARKLADMLALRESLARFAVLDPACGSGNFLFVAYRELKHVEMELLARIHGEFQTGFHTSKTGPVVSLEQFHGIDIDPFAVELAKVTLSIGKKLAIDEARLTLESTQLDLDVDTSADQPLPLENLDRNIIRADALLCDWPRANVIIGNPPYQSKNKMQKEFGRAYVNRIREKYPGVPGRADYCVYWFRRTHDELMPQGRAGLVGTNTIRQNYSREGGLDYIVQNGGTIVDAVSTMVWPGDAAVHVSIVNWTKGADATRPRLVRQVGDQIDSPWESKVVDRIDSALSFDADVTDAIVLLSSAAAGGCFQGQTHGNAGFLLAIADAQNALRQDASYRAVLFPFLTADDLLGNPGSRPSRYVIDFGQLDQFSARKYDVLFEHVKATVLPKRTAAANAERENNRLAQIDNPDGKIVKDHENALSKWWQLFRARGEMISVISGLSRYIVCGRVTKRPIFEFIRPSIHPNDALMVFPYEDDYAFGVLQSSAHWHWFMGRCSTLKGDFRYTSNTVFDTFPWPQSPSASQIRRVANAAVSLRNVRQKLMLQGSLSLRDLYRTLDDPGTNALRDAHDALDSEVREAYGSTSAGDTLEFLGRLNATLAERQGQKDVVIGPGLAPHAGRFARELPRLVTDDSVALQT
jgi:SAM-dependent methyltransferase